MSSEEQERPYIKYGKYVLTADGRQWIVALEDKNDNLYNKSFHMDLSTALYRLADRSARNTAITSLEELSEYFDEVKEYFKSKFDPKQFEQNE